MSIFYKNKTKEEKKQAYHVIFGGAFQSGKKLLCVHVCMYVLACVHIRAVSLAVVVSGPGTMYKYHVFILALI